MAPKSEQILAYGSGGWTRNLHNANKYSTALLYITSNMSNPIIMGHFGTLLLIYSLLC